MSIRTRVVPVGLLPLPCLAAVNEIRKAGETLESNAGDPSRLASQLLRNGAPFRI